MAPVLPPCHPLIDTQRTHATQDDAKKAAIPSVASEPAPAQLKAGAELLSTLRVLCSRIPAGHPLEGLAKSASHLARLHAHPRCPNVSPWATCSSDEARQSVLMSLERAVAALSPIGVLGASLGKRSTAKRDSAVLRVVSEEQSAGTKAEASEVVLHLRGAEPTRASSAARSTTQLPACSETALSEHLHELTACRPPPAHLLAPVALIVAKVFAHPDHPTWATAGPVVQKAAAVLHGLTESLEGLIGRLPPSAASRGTAEVAACACAPNTYRSYLLHLSENKARLGRDLPASVATTRQVESLAASEFRALDETATQALGQRALQLYRDRLGAMPNDLAGLERRGSGHCLDADGCRVRPNRRPCSVCSEASDARDAIICSRCGGRTHLMCFFPPRIEVQDDEVWECDECRTAIPPPLSMPKEGDELEAEVCEPEAKGGAIVWKRAIVLKVLPRATFRLMINPDEEDDFIEEYGMEEQGKEWRWPAAAVAANAAARERAEVAAKQVAAERAAVAAAVAAEARPRPCEELPLVEEFYRDGMCVFEKALSEEQVQQCEDVVERGYKRYMHSVKTLDLQEKLSDVGFFEIKMRSAGRYDLQLPELSSPSFSFLTSDAPWMPLVHALLGSDAVLTHFGCMLSFPGSATQPWHSDGPHIRGCGENNHRVTAFDGKADNSTANQAANAADEDSRSDAPGANSSSALFTAPVHALNIFVPLVDLTAVPLSPPPPARHARAHLHAHPCTRTPG